MTRSGFTLIEVLVVLVILGATVALAGVGLEAAVPQPSPTDWLVAKRAEAFRDGRTVWVEWERDTIGFFTDGSAVGPTAVVDPWTGGLHVK